MVTGGAVLKLPLKTHSCPKQSRYNNSEEQRLTVCSGKPLSSTANDLSRSDTHNTDKRFDLKYDLMMYSWLPIPVSTLATGSRQLAFIVYNHHSRISVERLVSFWPLPVKLRSKKDPWHARPVDPALPPQSESARTARAGPAAPARFRVGRSQCCRSLPSALPWHVGFSWSC